MNSLEDALRRLFLQQRDEVEINLPAGDYEFTGDGDCQNEDPGTPSTYGFRVGRGWRIRGAGIGSTRIRLVPRQDADRRDGAALFNIAIGAVGASFSDLSIDANWPAFEALGYIGVVGIGGRINSGLRIERVEITGHGGAYQDTGGAIYGYAISTKAQRVIVRDCWIHDGYGAACLIGLASNNHHTAAEGNLETTILSALVENNLLQGPGGIAVGIQGSNGRIIGNRIEGCTYGCFGDTGFQYDQLFADNHISGTYYPFYFAGGYFDAKRNQPGFWRNTIRDNVIDVAGGLGIYLGDNCGENVTEGNIIRADGKGNGRAGLVFASEFRNVARNNEVDASLLTVLPVET